MSRRIAFLALLGAFLTASCGGTTATQGIEDVRQLKVDMAHTVLGLKVTAEDVSETLEGARPAYADALALYSFRQDELLEATLQVTRFSSDVEFTERLRDSIINRLGGSTPQSFRAGDQIVYETTTAGQLLDVWFKDRHMFVLAVRDDFTRPASLLREALEVSA